MNREEAREILLLYRPDIDESDPEFGPALTLARTDPELHRWLEQHCAMQKAVFASFDQMVVPEGLKEQIISERKSRINLPSRRAVIALAVASFAILFLLGALLMHSGGQSAANTFDTFRLRMAGKVLRDYPKMDLETSDLAKIRAYLGAHGGEKDYVLPAGLAKANGTGCAIFDWHGKKVSMLCFASAKRSATNNPDLFLFITEATTAKPPENAPTTAQIRKLSTVSWTSEGKTYLLAGAGDEKFLQQYY